MSESATSEVSRKYLELAILGGVGGDELFAARVELLDVELFGNIRIFACADLYSVSESLNNIVIGLDQESLEQAAVVARGKVLS